MFSITGQWEKAKQKHNELPLGTQEAGYSQENRQEQVLVRA